MASYNQMNASRNIKFLCILVIAYSPIDCWSLQQISWGTLVTKAPVGQIKDRLLDDSNSDKLPSRPRQKLLDNLQYREKYSPR